MLDLSSTNASPGDVTRISTPLNVPWHPFLNLPVSKRTPLTIERALGFWFERGISRPQKADRPYFGEAIPDLLRQIDLLNVKYRSVSKKMIGESQGLQDELTRLFNQLAPRLWPDYPEREQAFWLVDAAAETNDPLYPRDLFASKPEDAQVLHSLFCDLIIAKLMKKSENNARDERERKRRSTLADGSFDHSADFEITGPRSGEGNAAIDGPRDAPAARHRTSSAEIKEASHSDDFDEDGDMSDGSDDSVVPFRAHNWNAVNTAVMDSVASRTRPLKKKSIKAMSTAGFKRPAETHTPKRVTKARRSESAAPSNRQLLLVLKLDPSKLKLISLPHRPSRSPTITRHATGTEEGAAVDQSFKRPSLPPEAEHGRAIEPSFKRPSLPPEVTERHVVEPPSRHVSLPPATPVSGQQTSVQGYTNDNERIGNSVDHLSLNNGTATQAQPSSTSKRSSVTSLPRQVPPETAATEETSAPREFDALGASYHMNHEYKQPQSPSSARSNDRPESTSAAAIPDGIYTNPKASEILKRTKCYFDMADAIGRPGVVCFPLSRVEDADSLFSVVESYVPAAFQRENTPRAITISLFRPSAAAGSCELPFEPCFVKADPWSRYTFEAFFLALEQRLVAAAGTVSPPHLLLSAVWEHNSRAQS